MKVPWTIGKMSRRAARGLRVGSRVLYCGRPITVTKLPDHFASAKDPTFHFVDDSGTRGGASYLILAPRGKFHELWLEIIGFVSDD